MRILGNIYYSMPVQLFLLHLRKNQALLLFWVILFVIVGNGLGRRLGIPYLFLDPEYLNKVNFLSFFIMGVVTAGFTIAFNITSYILDGIRFNFVAALTKPFTKFSINNSFIPLAFFLFYMIAIINFQLGKEFASPARVTLYVSGLISGYLTMILLLYLYFRFTNKDIFKYVVSKVDEELKSKVRLSRGKVMARISLARDPKRQVKVNNYLDLNLKVKKVNGDQDFYNKETLLKVFDQNHFNLIIIQLVIFILLILMGVLRDKAAFQLPAAASFVLLITIFIMFTGAFSYWLRGWTTTIVIILILGLNLIVKENIFSKRYYAYGLDYNNSPVEYNLETIRSMTNPSLIIKDKANTLTALENWRSKFDKKPKMIFTCVSGGGQRAALWTVRALQTADSLTRGKLMDHTMLITGASGGLIGASYFRELLLRKQYKEDIRLYDDVHLENIAKDNLNPIIFSLLVNDLFVNLQKFDYDGLIYPKDRGYAFERQLNLNTNGVLDKKVSDYYEPEQQGQIPMIIIAPTIINDGRKLFISSHGITYMNSSFKNSQTEESPKIKGIDFRKLFRDLGADNLRYLSALRMSATFPYITPNITLPSQPPMEIMDAGISDNFGIADAIRFIFVFRKWIEENTSGVILLSVRDSQMDEPIKKRENLSLFEKISTPIFSVYSNFGNLQDLNNESKVDYARTWFGGEITRINLQYIPEDNLPQFETLNEQEQVRLKEELAKQRASLSWHLTSREKKNIIDNINTPRNKAALMELKLLLED